MNKNSTIFNSKFYKLKHLWKANANLCVWQIQQFNIHISKFLSNIKFSSLRERGLGWKDITPVFSRLAQASRPFTRGNSSGQYYPILAVWICAIPKGMVFEPFPLQNGNRLCSLWSEIRFGFQGNHQSIQRCVFQAPSDQRG